MYNIHNTEAYLPMWTVAKVAVSRRLQADWLYSSLVQM